MKWDATGLVASIGKAQMSPSNFFHLLGETGTVFGHAPVKQEACPAQALEPDQCPVPVNTPDPDFMLPAYVQLGWC